MLIRQDPKPAWPTGLDLRRRIAIHARPDHRADFRVGLTADVDGRVELYHRLAPGFTELVVLGQTTSETQMRETERDLRQWYRDDFDSPHFGVVGADGPPPYYLYVALR
ncbi:hypothetical protein [Ideonella alba]|uniref:Uncharacterized protein n=1 Tax=Ideonella alba TaxID=2824118 RepID=A0A940YJA0_9BURK|nr:hypothetical protein [Ideonella alba]MBQ0933432.1 hypothetical protein [Ideonella alba]